MTIRTQLKLRSGTAWPQNGCDRRARVCRAYKQPPVVIPYKYLFISRRDIHLIIILGGSCTMSCGDARFAFPNGTSTRSARAAQSLNDNDHEFVLR
eukprot:2280606-Rhodomonas_salina.1